MSNSATSFERILVFYSNDFVINFGVQSFRHKACANALNLMRSGNALRQHRRTGRLYSNNLNIGILRLQVFAYTGNSTACTNASNKDVNLAFSILPDFRTGRRSMRCRISRISELARDKAVRRAFSKLLCFSNRALHALRTIGQHQLCAIGLQQVAAFNAHRFRHGQNNFVATRSSYRCQTDTGVAAGGLNNSSPRLQRTLCFCVVNHCLSNSILYAASRIEVFQLAQNLCFQLVCSFVIFQLQQRSAANQISNASINCHDNRSFSFN